MQAILMTAVGAPEVLKLSEIAQPEITLPTEVKVKLKAAGINPVDTKIRRNGLLYDRPLPAILGCDGAGEVIAVGAEVDRFKAGDSVWFCHGGLGREPGNYAEYTVVDQRFLAKLSDNHAFIQAAAAPLVLITAWGALYDRGGLSAGQTVLIHAGAGGVGHVAIQLAKLRGAKVITTVSNDAKAKWVKTLGADVVINYRQEDFVAVVNSVTAGAGADLVIDTVGPEVFKQSIAATAHFGRLVTLLDPGQIDLKEARLRNLLIGFELMLTPILRDLTVARAHHVEILKQCDAWMEQGKLRVEVSQVLPLSHAAEAHALIEAGHVSGKLVLKIAD